MSRSFYRALLWSIFGFDLGFGTFTLLYSHVWPHSFSGALVPLLLLHIDTLTRGKDGER